MSVILNEARLVRSRGVIRCFLEQGLAVPLGSGRPYVSSILEACAYNTYVETISQKADALYQYAHNAELDMMVWAYRDGAGSLARHVHLSEREVMLAFDYTDEDFYGKIQGFDLYPWTKEEAVTGKFKFLTCSVIDGELGERIPLFSIHARLGHDPTEKISYSLTMIEKMIGPIKLILFDRGFYINKLMHFCNEKRYNYLIFTPKNEHVKKVLTTMQNGEKKVEHHEFDFSSGNTTEHGSTYLAFLKGIFSRRLNKDLDWIFSTNLPEIDLNSIITTYMKRWNIENNFKMQDVACIKTKSSDVKVRFLFFCIQNLLLSIWKTCYKKDVSFKEFIIQLHKLDQELDRREKAKVAKNK